MKALAAVGRVVLVGTLASCVKQTASTRPQASAPAPASSDVPASVAKLFVQGTKWTFPLSRRVHVVDEAKGPDADAKETITTGTVTCEVSFAGPRPHGRNARLTCSADVGIPLQLTATPDGLWALAEGNLSLDPTQRLLDEPPKERDSTTQFTEASSTRGVTSGPRGRWCSYEMEGGMGQSSGWMLCVRNGELVGGRYTKSGFDGFTTLEWGEFEERVPL